MGWGRLRRPGFTDGRQVRSGRGTGRRTTQGSPPFFPATPAPTRRIRFPARFTKYLPLRGHRGRGAGRRDNLRYFAQEVEAGYSLLSLRTPSGRGARCCRPVRWTCWTSGDSTSARLPRPAKRAAERRLSRAWACRQAAGRSLPLELNWPLTDIYRHTLDCCPYGRF